MLLGDAAETDDHTEISNEMTGQREVMQNDGMEGSQDANDAFQSKSKSSNAQHEGSDNEQLEQITSNEDITANSD